MQFSKRVFNMLILDEGGKNMLKKPTLKDYKSVLGDLESKSMMNLKCGTGHGGNCGGTTKCKCINPISVRQKKKKQ